MNEALCQSHVGDMYFPRKKAALFAGVQLGANLGVARNPTAHVLSRHSKLYNEGADRHVWSFSDTRGAGGLLTHRDPYA